MGLKFFNTLSRSVQEFAPLDAAGRQVGMYCCGPTVYDFAHIGNWRTFVFGDLVRRYLAFKGYEVRHVMNITDVEDKIIKRVRETKSSLREFTGKYEAAFLDDLKALNCLMPHVVALEFQKAPDEIGEDERAPVADVGEVIDRRPAAIHADSLVGRIQRRKLLHGARQRVEQCEGHFLNAGGAMT